MLTEEQVEYYKNLFKVPKYHLDTEWHTLWLNKDGSTKTRITLWYPQRRVYPYEELPGVEYVKCELYDKDYYDWICIQIVEVAILYSIHHHNNYKNCVIHHGITHTPENYKKCLKILERSKGHLLHYDKYLKRKSRKKI